MITTSQFCMLLLNIYFNLLVISPLWQSYKNVRYNQITSYFLFDVTPESIRLETQIDAIMKDYVRQLRQISKIQNEAQALTAIQDARIVFSKRVQRIVPEIKVWKQSLSKQEANNFTDKMLIKPYFKAINDLNFAYTLGRKGDRNVALLNAYQDLNECVLVLYN